MKRDVIQRVVFIFAAVCVFLTPILDMFQWFKFTLILAAVIYLGLGWSFTMIKDGISRLANELVCFFYATVFIGNFLETSGIPHSTVIVYLGYSMATALMIYMLLKRKAVKKDMIIQSIVLFYLAPVPLFI